jgi:drug/metabolite transporter (DMT)-like permease
MSSPQVFTWIDNDHLSMIMVLFGSVIYNFGFIYVNEMKIHPITTALSRGIVLSSLSYLLSRKFSTEITYKSPYLLKWLVIRSSIMIVQGLAFATVQFYLPQPIAITINSSPPIFVSILDYFLNGIIMNRLQIVFLFVSLIGVILTINGSYIITYLD